MSTWTQQPPPSLPPLIIACISCERIVHLSNAKLTTRTDLGLRKAAAAQDTFIPTTCSDCEASQSHMHMQLDHAPETRNVWPGTISASMLSMWEMFSRCREKWRVDFDKTEGWKLVVRRRDVRRKVLTGDYYRVELWFKDDREPGGLKENYAFRMDSFFGQYT